MPTPVNNLQCSVGEVVRQLLIDVGLAADLLNYAPAGPWPAYANKEPNDPDDCVTCYTTTGYDGGRAMTDGSRMRLFGFQVRVRSADSGAGYAKADQVNRTLSEQVYDRTVYVDGVPYLFHAASRLSDVIPLPPGPTDQRSLHTFNGVASIRQLS